MQQVHIVCFDVPYPANYGGAIACFNLIKALHKAGVGIHLHCFEYGRGEQEALKGFCENVYYYKRITGLSGMSVNTPYIVNSRRNKLLLERLNADNLPVILEGIHTTYYLQNGKLDAKRCFVRLHNIESDYYSVLAKSEPKFFKRLYYNTESGLLKKYEAQMKHSDAQFMTIALNDFLYFKSKLQYKNISYLPLIVDDYNPEFNESTEPFCLYHGNLCINENVKAVEYLANSVFKFLPDIKLVVAGNEPDASLAVLVNKYKNIEIIANPAPGQMLSLVKKAHINISYSVNKTGIKLKLIESLFNGNFSITNSLTVSGTELEPHCIVIDNAGNFTDTIRYLMERPFTRYAYDKRIKGLQAIYNNELNIYKLLKLIQTQADN